jgi:uracil-DNA glycosylase
VSLSQQLLNASRVHDEWRPLLTAALACMDQQYLQDLLDRPDWLPGPEKLFAAFQRDLSHCRYLLFGESPYPRQASANGIAFYDAAVDALWSEKGLSKAVNRATSLRNLLKTALVAENLIRPQHDGSIPQSSIAALDKQPLIQTIGDLFAALQQRGFLLLNATPVLHTDIAVKKESRYWLPFIECLLLEIQSNLTALPTLVLWGKIADNIDQLPQTQAYSKIRCEHPYNISFIHNPQMQKLFASLKLLHQN